MKIKSLFETFAGTILGVLLIFMGMVYFDLQGGWLAYGIITFVLGVFYVGCTVLKILKLDAKVPVLKTILAAYEVCAFPWTYFVLSTVWMANIAEAIANQFDPNVSATDWIINISLLSVIVALNVFAVISMIIKKPIFTKLATIFFAAFFAVIVLTLVFATFGGNGNIGGLSLYELFTLGCYGSLVLGYLAGKGDGKEEPAEEAAPEEAPAEKAVEEEPAEEAPAEEATPEEPAEAPAE